MESNPKRFSFMLKHTSLQNKREKKYPRENKRMMDILFLEAPNVWLLPVPLDFWMKECARVSSYSASLGGKRRKIGVLNQNMLKNKQQALSDHVPCAGCMCASGSLSCANFVVFVPFRAFFRLAIPWSLKWIFFSLYCIQIPFKNHWYLIFISSILHLVSCFADMHDFSLKRHKTPMAKKKTQS